MQRELSCFVRGCSAPDAAGASGWMLGRRCVDSVAVKVSTLMECLHAFDADECLSCLLLSAGPDRLNTATRPFRCRFPRNHKESGQLKLW